MLGGEEVDLAVADAVLAGAGAAHRERAHHEAVIDLAGDRELLRLVRVDDVDEVEVAVADVAHDRCHQRAGREVALGLEDAFGQT